MSKAKKFDQIEFSRLGDLVPIDVPGDMDEMTYVANASNFRRALLNTFGRPDWNASEMIAAKEDTCLTYRGYVQFLQTDLMNVYPVGDKRSKTKFRNGVGTIAKQMLGGGDAFSRAVNERFGDHPLPTESRFKTPWHCAVAFCMDGTLLSGHRSEFDSNPNFELVYEHGHRRTHVPCGLMIRPVLSATGSKRPSIETIDAQKVRTLSEHNSLVMLRGFYGTTDRDRFVSKATEFGTPLPRKFGLVLEVKDRGADQRDFNGTFSAEGMPFHYDGVFKTEKRPRGDGQGEELVQFFTAVTPSPNNTGFTLFSPSSRIWPLLPCGPPLSQLQKLTWLVETKSFDGAKLNGLPLVIPHPTIGTPCLRYHEPWPQFKTAFESILVEIEGISRESGAIICATLDSLLYDRRVCYWHSWEKGDVLVSDNIASLHTRSSFTAGADRELWRIHLD
ncbi:uncharacterized protein BCR38DRAFT_489563 [Pseudomassariella vexata]|uniref:TauD/TfdA-like domain-containing protein n=1 Tax=Pseudomassariella vexata TaxID=1141098 RepID=A0A1Y2DFV1_9PEZI|nr:uncharacterized protein BCR38DRAFT_489563 [Pseudomassariella vexata]ORY58077.1 hypothetical protein BCR38DRAFT_489563 [Pseudomassariella vexata]